MARINKTDVIQRAVNDLALSSSVDKIPNETLDKIQLTYPLTPKFSNRIATLTSSATGSGAIFTTSATKETYICGINIAVTSDATADSTSSSLTVVIDGVAKTPIRINKQTLTAGSAHAEISFPYPLKIDKNSAVTAVKAFTVGAEINSYSIIYLEINPSQ